MIDKLQSMYNNQLSKISGQQPAETTRNSELKEVAKEMEAVFAYQLIKEMRKTSNSMFSENAMGSDTYMSLFDMELSNLFAERGLGLQDAMMRWLERAPNTADINYSDETDDIPEPELPEKPGVPKLL